jgi:malonate decarboxylase gamma subunit
MTLAELLRELIPAAQTVTVEDGVLRGFGRLKPGDTSIVDSSVHVLGIVEGVAVGLEQALRLAGHVLQIAGDPRPGPILLLLDCGSQRMSRRDELLGLNEYLAHLIKALLLAEAAGHPSVGLLYGHAAAGAFIATGLTTSILAALPQAVPEVMDLPSMARVTKLSLESLQSKAATTPVFAPGLDNLASTGAVAEVLHPQTPLGPQIAHLLERWLGQDLRDQLGAKRGGRPKAADIAARVCALATHV